MISTQTQSEKDRAERTVYVAIDAVQRLCDRGYGCLDTERVFEHLRSLESKIANIPVRPRKGAV